ncbi:GNAT family N-acetyltransferase [Rhabdobacter roseus]|uniref:RimJ/RimL family protein N-acetyltransferase n=1 Tax=Rhabdobacter roseus TaxID=1655419 RepID=A0A840TXD5_9BACT|nr:GNAT family N-acetyltransferase [Rhabdobacter roseus]MBB5286272.1 RimJ/RimL family protein N-acetyltransferase [Rhabdobacter roseus]
MTVIKLRPYRREDAENLVRYANNPGVTRGVRDSFPSPYTSADAQVWIAQCLEEPAASRQLNRAITLADELIGGIGVIPNGDVFRYSAEVGYWLGEPFWGQGYASDALRQITALAFAQTDLHRLYAGVFAFNQASMRVLEKAGYHREAIHQSAVYKEGQFWDEHLFVKFRG